MICLSTPIGLSVGKFSANRRTEVGFPLHFLTSISDDALVALSTHSSPVRREVIKLQTKAINR